MIEWIIELLQANQFMSGGIATVVFSALLYQGRMIGMSLYQYIKRKISSVIYTESGYSDDFAKIDYWVSQNFAKKANALILSDPPKIAQCSIMQIKNWCLIHINKTALEKENVNYAVYRYNLRIYGLKRLREQIVQDIIDTKIPYDQGSPVKHNYITHSYLKNVQKPITESAKKIHLDYVSFLKSESVYANYGLKYHRNYLLHGEPGTGKSSVLKYIARTEQKKIQSISINPLTSDCELLEHFACQENTIFLLEDFDRIEFDNKDNTWTKSTLMNVLDGVYTSDGSVVIATVNNLSKLDSAFIRNGRFDVIIEFKNPTKEEWKQYIQENKLPLTLDEVKDKTIAEVQKLLKEKI